MAFTVVAQELGGVTQLAPCTAAIRVAYVTAYVRVLYVHIHREISMTAMMASIMEIPASVNSTSELPRRDRSVMSGAVPGHFRHSDNCEGPRKEKGKGNERARFVSDSHMDCGVAIGSGKSAEQSAVELA
jgi:hypothetical protein